MDAKDLVRFYQRFRKESLLSVLFRIRDPFKNKHTFLVQFCISGLLLKMNYRMYSSWTDGGTPLSINNISRTIDLLPKFKTMDVTIVEAIENELAAMVAYMDETGDKTMAIDLMNRYFDNALIKIEKVLKQKERLAEVE